MCKVWHCKLGMLAPRRLAVLRCRATGLFMAPGQLLMRTQSSRAVGEGAQRCELGVLAFRWLAVCAVPGSGVHWCARAATDLIT